MILAALFGLAIWIVVSIPAALLFSRMVTLNEHDDPPARKRSTSSFFDVAIRELHESAGAQFDRTLSRPSSPT